MINMMKNNLFYKIGFLIFIFLLIETFVFADGIENFEITNNDELVQVDFNCYSSNPDATTEIELLDELGKNITSNSVNCDSTQHEEFFDGRSHNLERNKLYSIILSGDNYTTRKFFTYHGKIKQINIPDSNPIMALLIGLICISIIISKSKSKQN